MERKAGKAKRGKVAQRGADFKGKQQASKRRPQRDESDREEEEAKEEINELQNRAKGEFFEAFSASSEDEEAMADELEQEASEEDQPETASEFQVNGEHFKTLLKDLRLYDLRLAKLSALERSARLSEEGRAFVEQYKRVASLYSLYLLSYLQLAAQGGVTVHPVLRALASLKEQVKVFDKEFAHHKETANRLADLAQEEAGFSAGEEEGDSAEDEEDLADGLEEASEEDARLPAAQPRVKPAAHSAKHQVNQAQKSKPKPQIFKLDLPTSYADIHHYAPDEDDEDEGYLNLAANAGKKEAADGEITMADFAAFNSYQKAPKQVKKATARGKKLYEELSQQKAETKSLANALREETEAALDQYERKLMFNERKVKEDQPRTLTEEMLLNRGLRQKRKKQISKVKLRGKYEKAKRQDRIRKGLSLEDGRSRDIHMIKSTGEGVVRAVALN